MCAGAVIVRAPGLCAAAAAFVASFALGMLGVDCPGNSGWGRDGAGGAGIRRAAGEYDSRLVCGGRGPDVGAVELVGGGGAACWGGAGGWAGRVGAWSRAGTGGAGIRRAAGQYYSRLVCAARGPDVGAIDLVGGGGASCLGGAGSWADLGRPLALAGTKTFARG